MKKIEISPKVIRLAVVFAVALFSAFILFSCYNSGSAKSIESEKLFTLEYGKFDNQLNLFNISSIGNINTYIAMRDGFFYIANGESSKIMEMNSYGDLLTLYFNKLNLYTANTSSQTAPLEGNISPKPISVICTRRRSTAGIVRTSRRRVVRSGLSGSPFR